MPDNTTRPFLPFELEEPVREQGRVLVASGTRSRNRDWLTGKPYRLNPPGMRLESWQKNNVVLWMHNFDIPLAKGELFVEDNQLWAPDDFQFHRQVIPVATQGFFGGGTVGEFDTGVIADLWNEKFFNAVSIHVMFTPEDETVIVENDEEIFFPTSEVIEFSIVTVPGDREAVREELVDRMIFKGVDQAVAECVACTKQPVFIPPTDLWTPSKNVSNTANSGSRNYYPVEVNMDNELQAQEEVTAPDEVVAEAVTEPTATLEETVEIEQELEIDVVEIVQAITENPQAVLMLAQAIAGAPAALGALSAAFTPLEPIEAVPQKITLKLTSSQPQPPAAQPVQQHIMQAAPVQQARPVALPESNGQEIASANPFMAMATRKSSNG